MRARVTNWDRPDYVPIFRERSRRLDQARRDKSWHVLFRHYRDNPVDAIEDWLFTYDPRHAVGSQSAYVPLVLFDKQREYVRWLHDRLEWAEEGIVEKSRDMGVTWVSLAFAWWLWMFRPGAKISFGSRKEALVDRIGDPDSIFEKFRMMMKMLPPEMQPKDWDEKIHAPYMKLINPENGNTITGEAGKNIGRGGRSTIYFVDEAAFMEYADLVDRALSENSDCKIYVSTPNGTGNPFYRKRHSGNFPVFTFHWSDDPRKGEGWYAKRKKALEPEALAQEVDLDYEASAGDTVVRALWVRASRAMRKQLAKDGNLPKTGTGIGGLDVGGGGSGKSVFLARYGPIVGTIESWSDNDTIDVAGRAREHSLRAKCPLLKYDVIGIGKGVAAGFRRMEGIRAQGVNVGARPTRTRWPDGKKARDKFSNLKAELWWTLRDKLRRTHEHWLFMNGEGGLQHELDDLLLLPDDEDLCSQLSLPRYNHTESGKIQIETKRSLATRGIPSPDHAESLMLTYAPAPARRGKTRTVGLH